MIAVGLNCAAVYAFGQGHSSLTLNSLIDQGEGILCSKRSPHDGRSVILGVGKSCFEWDTRTAQFRLVDTDIDKLSPTHMNYLLQT